MKKKKRRDVVCGEVFYYPDSTYVYHKPPKHRLSPYQSEASVPSLDDSYLDVIVMWSPPEDQKHTDVVAPGPTQMLDDAARALGWRTDFAGGGSPITWDLVLQEIKKLRTAKKTDPAPQKTDDTRDRLKKLDQILELAGQMYEHARATTLGVHWSVCDPAVRALWIQLAMLSS